MIGKVVPDDFSDVCGAATFAGGTPALPGGFLALVLAVSLVLGCGRPAASPEVTVESGSPSPAISPVSAASPSPTSPPLPTTTPTAVPPTPTLIPPPPLSGAASKPSAPAPPSTSTPAPTATAAPAGPSVPPTSESAERARVSGTDGLGANLREQPGTEGALLKTLPDGAELTVVGADRQVGDQAWRNVRDAEGTTGWVVAEALERIGPTPTPSPADAAAPCRVGQLKGDATSGLFYPAGHPGYASKKDRVRCFDAEPQARASGFQPAP